MGDSELRIPKGILKASKYGGSSNSRDGLEVGEHPHHQQMSYSTAYGGGGWDPQLGMPVAPVPAPNHGMNMPNPVLDPILRGIKSEFPNMHLKVNEFISKKRELIFRPLDPDETPVSEVKGDQRNVEDHYAVLPSLDQFLRVDKSEIIRYFYKNAQAGDLLIGRVISSNSTGVSMRLICTDGGKQVVLDDFSLRAFCPNSQSLPNPDSRDPRTYYDVDEYIRVEILDVNSQSEKLVVGMKGINLSTEMQHAYTLGVIRQSDLPRYYTLSVRKRTEDPRSHRHSYQDMLLESPGFQNPSSISHLARNMGLYNNSNSLIKGVRNGFPATEKASHLRRVQNAKWAHGHVAEGIKFYKAQKFTEAFQCLNSALNIDPENVEGLVARGALYANNGSFEKAIDDFESALKFNPNHFNARKYLAETLVALGRQQEHQGKLEDAIASYSKCLVVRSDHKDATEALLSLHARTEKLDSSKMTGPAAAKAAELKAKLKTILQGELGYKVERKEIKEKKSKKDKKKRDSSASDDDSSSSSSSDDSSSDSSSSDGGYKKKSKKRKRKKSKKKKSKKESERKKKELSLSPFAKRLVEPGQVGMTGNSAFTSGFTDSTYTELQLGIPKREEESDESKRSSKKSKDKKRSKKGKDKKKKRKHASSDSSSSDSEGERAKKKGKKQAASENTSLQGIIPDLGDLEAKLSAYYSKIEQDKIETKAPSSARRSRSRSRDRRSRTRSPVERRKPRDYNDIPPRVVENIPPVVTLDDKREERQGERTQSKFSLETDDYGNLIQQQTIIRTVKNDAPAPVEPPKPMKFEMKFKPVIGVPSNEGENGTSKAPPPPPELTSKWRPLGAAAPQSDALKNAFQRESPARSTGSREDRDKRSPPERRYRRKSRSLSRSPVRRRRRSRSYSSRSRSRSRSYSRSRSRSRSRSPSFRRRFRGRDRDQGSRGRGAVRFFRGYNYNRGGGGGRRGGGYNPRPYNNSRDFGGGSKSRFRNRFSHTPSRSRSRSKSRSRSRSRSPSPRRRDRSSDRRASARDDSSSKPVPQASDNRMEPDSASQPSEPVAPSEIQIGSLKTTSAADVEFLLDKRNAEKKEEMRKSNPEFFRAT